MFMAFRRVSSSLSSKLLLQNFRFQFIRPLNSLSTFSSPAVPPLNFAGKQDPTTVVIKPDPINNFEDGQRLFSSVSAGKLIRSALTLQMAPVAPAPVVDFGTWVMNSRLMELGLLKELILGITKFTFFDHFVVGTNEEEAGETIKMIWDYVLRGMLDYGLEHADDNISCDRNSEAFMDCPCSNVSFVVVKTTALSPVSLLKRVSDLLRWEYKEKSFHLPWKLNTLPIFSDSSPMYHTLQKPEPLTSQEEQDLQLAHQRLHKIIEKCLEANVPLVIDAEETLIQSAIDYFTYSAAIKHNKDDNPIILGTIQAYLKDAKERLLLAKKAADKMGLPMGVKLVRGAYVSTEKRVAASLGHESPIHNSIKHTHACYNNCASFMLEEIANGPGALVLATHNFESGKLAAAKAQDLGIGKERQKLQFAQLYGMADAMSYGLRNAGFEVSKYLPFGPVEQIIPYLLRRAEENKGVLSTSTLDRQLMRMELKRRLTAAMF